MGVELELTDSSPFFITFKETMKAIIQKDVNRLETLDTLKKG